MAEDRDQGKILEVVFLPTGDELLGDHLLNDTVISLYDTSDFSEAGGQVQINGNIYTYTARDDENDTLTLASGLLQNEDEDTEVYVYPLSEEKWAMVEVDDVEDSLEARVPHQLSDLIPVGIREAYDQETVIVELETSEWVITDVIGKTPLSDGSFIDPGTLPPQSPPPIQPPTVSPVPTVSGGVKALFIQMEPIANPSAFDVEVHVSDQSFSAVFGDTNTLAAQVTGTGALVDTFPLTGEPLEQGKTYYVRLIAFNDQGAAAQSAEATGQLKQINSPDVATEAVWAGYVQAESILAGQVDVVLDLQAGGEIKAAAPNGSKVSMSGADGIQVIGPTSLNNPRYIHFPTDGAPSIISGVLKATTLEVESDPISGRGASFKGESSLETGSTLLLESRTTAPVTKPVVVDAWLNWSVDFPAPSASGHEWNGHLDMTCNGDDMWISLQTYHNSHNPRGYIVRTPINQGPSGQAIVEVGILDYATGLTIVGTTLYAFVIQNTSGSEVAQIRSYNKDTLAHIATVTLTDVTVPYVSGGSPVNGTWAWGAQRPRLAYDGGNLCVMYARASDDRWTIRKYATGAAVKNDEFTANEVYKYHAGFDAGIFDFTGSTRFMIMDSRTNEVRSFTYDGGQPTYKLVEQTTEKFPLAETSIGLSWDTTRLGFVALTANSSGYLMVGSTYNLYDGPKWTTESDKWWFATTIFSGVEETNMSPRASLTRKKRSRWSLTTSTNTFGQSRIYIGRGATDPGVSGMWSQTPDLTAGVISTTRTTARFAAPGVNPPAVSTFALGAASMVLAQEEDGEPISGFQFVSGSDSIVNSSPRIRPEYVGAKITGSGIQTDTYLLSAAADGLSGVMSKIANATVSSVTVTFFRPKIDIRGDGYARFADLRATRAQFTSLEDVNVSSGNKPPLVVGNPLGNHLRMDGNEIQSMSLAGSTGNLFLNDGGGGVRIGSGSDLITTLKRGSGAFTSNGSGVITITHNLGFSGYNVHALVASHYGIPAIVVLENKNNNNFTLRLYQVSSGADLTNTTRTIDWRVEG